MYVRHNAQVIAWDGQQTQFLILGESIWIDDCQTDICQIYWVQLVQTMEGIGM